MLIYNIIQFDERPHNSYSFIYSSTKQIQEVFNKKEIIFFINAIHFFILLNNILNVVAILYYSYLLLGVGLVYLCTLRTNNRRHKRLRIMKKLHHSQHWNQLIWSRRWIRGPKERDHIFWRNIIHMEINTTNLCVRTYRHNFTILFNYSWGHSLEKVL